MKMDFIATCGAPSFSIIIFISIKSMNPSLETSYFEVRYTLTKYFFEFFLELLNLFAAELLQNKKLYLMK